MPLFKPSARARRDWESLFWIELRTALDDLHARLPGLARMSLPRQAVYAVSRTGSRPFSIHWAPDAPGRAHKVEVPYFIMMNPVARRQAAWLLAGFLHAASRRAVLGPKAWKRICRAGGIAGVLLPGLRQALALHRLESQAMLMLAAGGRLSWARLRVPGILHWVPRVKHKDIQEAGWLGRLRAVAIAEAKERPLSGTAIWPLVREQVSRECAWLSKASKPGKGLRGPFDPAKQAKKLARHRKINNDEVIALLQEVEAQQILAAEEHAWA